MKHYIYILLILILSSCIDEKSLKPIVPNYLLHSNSAKTWVVNNEVVEGQNITAKIHPNKMTLTFFSDGEFYEQKLLHLATDKGVKGKYSLHVKDSDTVFYLQYKDAEKIAFRVNHLSNQKILISTINDSLKWELISYPKPF